MRREKERNKLASATAAAAARAMMMTDCRQSKNEESREKTRGRRGKEGGAIAS